MRPTGPVRHSSHTNTWEQNEVFIFKWSWWYITVNFASVADPICVSRIPIFSIPAPESGSATKNLGTYRTDTGVKKEPHPGSGSTTLNAALADEDSHEYLPVLKTALNHTIL